MNRKSLLTDKPEYSVLENRIQELEKKLKNVTHKLGERIKELDCLYSLSKLVEIEGASLSEILSSTVKLIPPSWQYPEVTCSRIIFDDEVFETENIKETEWKLSSFIKVFNKTEGIIEVFYIEQKPEIDEGPFLKEERNLINAIAERLGRIIERILTENKLIKSEQKYHHLFKYANDSIFIVNPDTNKFTDCNDIAAKRLGYTKEEMLKMTINDIDTSMKEEKYVAIIEEIKIKNNVVFEHKHRRKDGTILPVEISSHVIEYDGTKVFQSFVRDISERKQIEEELIRQKDFLNAVINSLSHPFYVVNIDNHEIEMANEAFINAYGIIPGSCFCLTHGFDKPCNEKGLSCPIQIIRENKKSSINEHVHYNKEGKKQFFEIHSFPIFDKNSNIKQIIVYSLNITDRKELEKNVAKLRKEYEAFLRHELKNRLTPVLGYSSLLKIKNIQSDDKIKDFNDKIYQATQHTIKLIDSIKKLQDIENGNYELIKYKHKLKDVIKSRLTDLQFLINDAKVKIKLENNAQNTAIEMDRELLPGVFNNLIKNAIEHVSCENSESEKFIKINMFNNDKDLVIEINNRGRTIPEEKLLTFFDKFNSNPKNKKDGMGLGTTYAYLVTKAHNGDISVYSDTENGTTVRLKFNTV